MHFLPKVSLSLAVACFSTDALASGNKYQCTVDDVVTFGDDRDFIASNMRKQYLVTLDDERVYVTGLSNEFSNSQSIYTIVNRSMSNIYAVNLDSVSINTIALSEHYFEGSYNATITHQYVLSATVWKLDCQQR